MKTIITIQPTPAMQAIARMAVECQDAVNAFAVLNSFVQHLDRLRCEDDKYRDGNFTAQNPMLIAVVDKLASLSRTQALGCGDQYHRIISAHDACSELAAGKAVEWEIFPL